MKISPRQIVFTHRDGKEYTAKRATDEQKQRAKAKNPAIMEGCTCGEEFCDGQWLWRCMYAGAGACDWFITYIV